MTSESKRSRGRPKGSGIDDTATLERIADLVVGPRAYGKTAAIRRVVGPDPSIVRRLQRKLKHDEAPLMTAASARRVAHEAASSRTGFADLSPAERRYAENRRPVSSNRLVRMWDDLEMWNQYGLAAVGGILGFVVLLEVAALFTTGT